ncbi:UBC-like protein [Obba rivulosa]|uniref:UBC-like protein n=1 Tax=Obba rivulosa TaxID=1052685 RepID=A0A8E2DK08_9APHY|nr:UBC-like protein [Obba rivulosa]
MFSLISSSPTIDLSAPTKSRAPPSRTVSASSATGPNTAETIAPALTRTAVSLEYASLRHAGHCPLGMYITPSVNDLLVWDAVFFVHQGYYTDSILRFRLTFPPNYPERPPVVQFLTDVFHPLISQQDGTFNLAPHFKPWKPKEHHVFDVLHWVKAAFKKQALDSVKEADCLNKEAYRYHDSTSSFAALATQSSMLSQSASALFDKDHPSMAGKSSHGITFRELKPEQLSALRTKFGLREWEDSS